MKKAIFITCFFMLCSIFYGMDYRVDFSGIDTEIKIDNSEFKIKGYNAFKHQEYELSTKIELLSENGMIYLVINNPNNTIPWLENGINTILILNSSYYIVIYNKIFNEPVFTEFSAPPYYFDNDLNVKASSHLTEKQHEYYPKCIIDLYNDSPWATNKNGGIDEYIKISSLNNGCFKTILLSNGYLCFSNSSLYRKNSRVKKIEIYNSDNKLLQIYEILDTVNFQEIELPDYVSEIKIIITETYKGTKYNDLCVNAILPVFFEGQ